MVIESTFRPPWWLRHAHLQTVWCGMARPAVHIDVMTERVELPDGDFVDAAWLDKHPKAPLVVAFHGLAGSVESQHMAGLMRALDAAGMGSVLMHFRGCSGEPNRLRRAYHAGDTGDIGWFLAEMRRRFPDRELFAFGVSLGANALLKYLGESGDEALVTRAAAVSPPFELKACADRMNRGFAKVYQKYLLDRLLLATRSKPTSSDGPGIALEVLRRCKTFWDFDEHVTAPLHGFEGAEDYYARSSCRGFLGGIRVPTLIVHSRDDPFFVPSVIPELAELSPVTRLELSNHGGHVGFRGRGAPGIGRYFLESRLPDWFAER